MTIIEAPDEVGEALLCIAGKKGNGDDRRQAVEADGLDYEKVRKLVNTILEVCE